MRCVGALQCLVKLFKICLLQGKESSLQSVNTPADKGNLLVL